MSTSYGSGIFTAGPYGGVSYPLVFPSIAVNIELYNSLYERKSTFQSGVGAFLGCEFTHDENGCRDFVLSFSRFQNITKGDIIKIKIFSAIDYFFTGVIREIPIQGSTKQAYDYSGFGMNDYLHRINAESLSYAADTLENIINDIIDSVIVVKTPIIKNAGKLNLPSITIDLDVNYSQVIDVLNTLKEIASSDGNYYIFGVDQSGEFFFSPKSDELKTTLIVGKTGRNGIQEYEPTEEITPRTVYYVLDKNGSYVTTVNTTQTSNDIYEEKITAPDIDNAAVALWAAGKIIENETLQKRASIQWKIENPDPLLLVADGNIRIISNIPPNPGLAENDFFGNGLFGSELFGGAAYTGYNRDDTLRVKQVKYIINSNSAIRQIELGSIPISLDNQMIGVKKELTDLKISLGR